MNHKFIIYLVSLAAFLGPFTQTIYAPVIPEVTSAFHTSHFLVNLTISIFTLILAFMQMVYGPLTDRQGRKKVLLSGLVIYIVASLGCFFASNIYVLLLFRAMQAIGIASGSVVAVTVIGDLYIGKQRGSAMGTFQMMVSLGPVLGPVVGGFLAGAFNFHSVFLALVVVGSIILVGNFYLLKETKPEDIEVKRFGLKNFVEILNHRTGVSIIVLGFIQYYSFYNFLVFLPTLLDDRYGLTEEQKGLVFLPMSLAIVVGSFIGGKLQKYYKEQKIVITTSFLNVGALLLFLLTARISLPVLITSIVLFGLFLGMSLPVQTTLLTGVFQSNRATAIGVYNFFRYMGMAIGPMLGSVIFSLAGFTGLFSFVVGIFLICSVYLMVKMRAVTAVD